MIWESQKIFKNTYCSLTKPVLDKFSINQMEFDIMMFLKQYPDYDTASDIINVRMLTKSHVSTTLESLYNRGLIKKLYKNNNKKTVHLKLTNKARQIVKSGETAMAKYSEILFSGFSKDDFNRFKIYFDTVTDNASKYLKKKEEGR